MLPVINPLTIIDSFIDVLYWLTLTRTLLIHILHN